MTETKSLHQSTYSSAEVGDVLHIGGGIYRVQAIHPMGRNYMKIRVLNVNFQAGGAQVIYPKRDEVVFLTR